MFLQWWFPIGSLYGFQSERTAQMVVPGEGDTWKNQKRKKTKKEQILARRTALSLRQRRQDRRALTSKIEWAAPPFDLLTGSVLTKITD